MQQRQQQQQTPQASYAALGILPEAAERSAERRLSRDDTAADVRMLMSEAGPSQASKGALHLTSEDSGSVWPPQDVAFTTQMRAQRQARRSVFRRPSNLTPSIGEGSAMIGQKSASLGRRFSKSYKDKVTDLKENVARAMPGKARRSSTSQSEAGPASKFGAPPPTSPSKRNGKHELDPRPTKVYRNLQGHSDRKDTPAPACNNATRPLSRQATAILAAPGGERARQAAAASKTVITFNEFLWSGKDDLNARRSRVCGSISSAADSAAELPNPYDSATSTTTDADGDVQMTDPVPSPNRDPLRALPAEVSLQIFEYLDAQDLCRAGLVHSTWNELASKSCVWRNAFLRRYQRQIYTDPAPVQVGGVGAGRSNRPNQQWKRMYKARKALDANWRKGPKDAGKAIYLSGHTDSVYCLQFDEEKIITGSRDRTIRVWDINNFTCQRVIGGPNVKPVPGPKVLRTVDYPDFHLATASVNGTAYGDTIYQTPSQWHDASILCLQYDDKVLVTGSSDSDLLVWDVKTYQPIKRLQKHSGGVLDVALDAKHIVSCSKDSKIIVWDRATLEPKGELSGHRGPVNAVQLRGKYLVSASGDGIARLWDLDQMKLVKEFSAKERGLAAVEFSEDMKYVLAGGNDTITYKFETDTGKEVKQFTGHSQLVRSLWLDSQNSRVVSGSYDLDLRVYDFNTGEEIWRAEEWTTSWMLAAKSDYRRIVATSQDGRILVIDFGLQKLPTPDDGQPIDGVDLLRGIDNTNAIEWRDPWARARKQDREREQRYLALQRSTMEMLGFGGELS